LVVRRSSFEPKPAQGTAPNRKESRLKWQCELVV
jgi:hypothetical protein